MKMRFLVMMALFVLFISPKTSLASGMASYEQGQPNIGSKNVGQASVGVAGGDAPNQSDADEKRKLAEAAQNPVADMISLPIQNNMGLAYGPHSYGDGRRVQNIMNVQPVVPVHLNENWNLISRTILPILEQPLAGNKNAQKWGIGDVNETLFLSPAKPKHLIWGIGPILGFPTATDSEVLGTQKWTVGPSIVALKIKGPWVVGGLANQQWSYAGADNRRSVNLMLVQPFINYNFGHGTYLTSVPIMTANWANHNPGQCWTIPIGGGIGQIVKIGKLPVNFSVQGYYHIMHPTMAPDWTLRLQVMLLFPIKKK
jgi:hypothetical protein